MQQRESGPLESLPLTKMLIQAMREQNRVVYEATKPRHWSNKEWSSTGKEEHRKHVVGTLTDTGHPIGSLPVQFFTLMEALYSVDNFDYRNSGSGKNKDKYKALRDFEWAKQEEFYCLA